MNVKPAGIMSLIAALGAVLNIVFNMLGLPSIPVDENAIGGVVNGLAAFVGICGTAWYNFNVTKEAKEAQKTIDKLKGAHFKE